MTSGEQELIKAIEALPGHQVSYGRQGGSISIYTDTPNGVRSTSVWLGKPKTIERLQQILDAAKGPAE
jgi:hypothetical protein